jgi:hypothetical protein
MSAVLAIFSLGLLIGLAFFFFKNEKLSRLIVQRQAEAAAAKQQTNEIGIQCKAEVAAAKQQTEQIRRQCKAEITRIRKDTELAAMEAQKLVDQQIADMRAEGERVRQHYEGEARKVMDASRQQIAIAFKDVESLRKYAPLQDAENEIRKVLADAMSEATSLMGHAQALKSHAQALLEQARTTAENEGLRATERANSIYEQADARLNQATRDAGRIVADAEKRAKEIGGEAYEALRDKQLLERAAEAMRNVIEGYGDRYIIASHSLVDDLAVEFGYTSAGESLKSARAQSRRMVEQGEAAMSEYVESSRRETAVRFVIDAFNGRVDAILTRVKCDNYGVLEQEIRDAFSLVNLNGKAFRDARILPAYIDARLAELRWAVVVQDLARKQLEEQREVRARFRDEQKARKEREEQMRQAATEEELKKKVKEDSDREIAAAKNAYERASTEEKVNWEKKIADLQLINEGISQDLAVATEKKLTIAQQTKKGHVYIISNIGAFGEGIYKIGQTRREPQVRVDELGDASVPFDFYIHALIESNNAPVLEHKLQKRFLSMQINKINSRKEFFRVTLKNIREEVDRLKQSEDFTVTRWTDTASATQYKESLDIESDPQKMEKWLKRQQALADREISLDASSADTAEPETEETNS